MRDAAHLGIDGVGDFLERHRPVGAAGADDAVRRHQVLDRHVHQMRRGLQDFRSHYARRQRGRATAQHGAAAGIGAGAHRHQGAVAVLDLDILDPAAEFVGDHLRQRRLQPLAMRGDAESGGDAAGGIDPDRCGFGAGVDRHAGRDRNARADAGEFGIAGETDADPSPVRPCLRHGGAARRDNPRRSQAAARHSWKPDRSQMIPEPVR